MWSGGPVVRLSQTSPIPRSPDGDKKCLERPCKDNVYQMHDFGSFWCDLGAFWSDSEQDHSVLLNVVSIS